MAKAKRQPETAEDTYEERYSAFVLRGKHQPREVLDRLDEASVDLVQCAMRLGAASGVLMSAVTDHAIDGHKYKADKLVEALGAIEFQLEALRQAICWTREDVLEPVVR